MRLNGDDIQDYTFPPFCFNKQTFFNDLGRVVVDV